MAALKNRLNKEPMLELSRKLRRGHSSSRIRHPNRKKNRQRRRVIEWRIIRGVIVFVSS
jgi:hypothetical protein